MDFVQIRLKRLKIYSFWLAFFFLFIHIIKHGTNYVANGKFGATKNSFYRIFFFLVKLWRLFILHLIMFNVSLLGNSKYHSLIKFIKKNKNNEKWWANIIWIHTHTCSENVFFGVDAGGFADDKR